MKMRNALLLLVTLIVYTRVYAQPSVLTQHNDLNRSGWYQHEKILTTKNVKAGSFGKLFTRTVDDQIYAQPLVKLKLTMPGAGVKNVVFVATVNNSVYAFDADSANVTQPYWQVNLTPAGSRAIKNTDLTGACGGNYRDFSGNMGIVGTPVIDTTTNTLYVVARSKSNTANTYQQYLHALDITTGAARSGSPKLITAEVTGNGDGNVNGKVTFDPQKENQRSGLLLLNGVVYITYAAHCDWGPYHGWILGYDRNTLAQVKVYCTTPEGYNGGIWMSGAAPAADDAGNIYVAVGNGSVGTESDPSSPVNRSESAVKLVQSGSTLAVSTFFTPTNIEALEAADLDFGVTEVLLIPNTNRCMTGCKDGKIYLLDRDNMGGFNPNVNNVIQTIDLGTNAHLRSSLGYYKGEQKEFVYSWSENALLKAFPYNRTTSKFDLNNTVSSGAQGPTGNNGALLSVSSNGSVDTTAVLWASHAASGDANQSVRPGILRAFAANDVTKELWNSSQLAADIPGNYAKFVCPTVLNGKVYLATFSNQLAVYGLTGTNVSNCNTPNVGQGKTAVASSIETNEYPAAAAVDGNMATRWSSQFSDPQSIYIDLGRQHDLCAVALHWENAAGRDFKIQLSNDAANWNTISTVTNNTDLVNYLTLQGTGRYVRMLGTARLTEYGYSLYEFQVYGEPVSDCSTPGGLLVTDIYEASAKLNWNAGGATSFNVQYKTVSAASWTTVTTSASLLTLNGLSCATDYLFQVQGVCDTGGTSKYSAASAFSTLSCNANCGPLPTRWTTQDIGDVALAGAACYSNGVFTLKGSGDDIWNAADAFRFSYKTLVGDGEIRARIVSQDESNEWNKCGIMIRESLTPGSRHAFIALTSGNGIIFENRIATDGTSNEGAIAAGITTPYWLKLVKQGSVLTAYRSADGINWTQTGSPVDVGFGAGTPIYAGLAITSHDNAVLSTATVDNYLFSGVLEVELQSFTASLTLNNTVALQWVTTLEQNIRDFIVERSADNVLYTDIDTVQAVSNGRFTQTYNLEDTHPLSGAGYYRLRITDNTDVTSYSAPVSVSLITSVTPGVGDNPPLVYDNPARNGVLHIKRGDAPIRMITLLDYSGRVMTTVERPAGIVTDVPVNTFANGLYLVEIRTSRAVYKGKIIIKN